MVNIESGKPKKQRLFHYNMPLHRKHAGLRGHLDKKLRQSLGRRSVQVRKGDSVKVLRGSKKGSSGKITGVNCKKGVVFIEKLVRKKVSGEEVPLPIHASNLLVVEVDRGDSKRFKRGKANAEPRKGSEAVQGKGKAGAKAAGKESKEMGPQGKNVGFGQAGKEGKEMGRLGKNASAGQAGKEGKEIGQHEKKGGADMAEKQGKVR